MPVRAGGPGDRSGAPGAAGSRGADGAAMIGNLFIRRPILATVCSLVIMLAGAISIPPLPVSQYPELTPPTVAVSANYTGANAQAVESAVTLPIEQDERRRGHALHDLVEREHGREESPSRSSSGAIPTSRPST